jgi:hypothetical protein
MMITILLVILYVYLIAGICFAPLFYWKGIVVIDESVKGSSKGFYVIILPGVIIFWPVLLHHWRKAIKK